MRLHPDWNPVPGVPWTESKAMKTIIEKDIKMVNADGKVSTYPMSCLSKFYRADMDAKGNHIPLPPGFQLIYTNGDRVTVTNTGRGSGHAGRGQLRGNTQPSHTLHPVLQSSGLGADT